MLLVYPNTSYFTHNLFCYQTYHSGQSQSVVSHKEHLHNPSLPKLFDFVNTHILVCPIPSIKHGVNGKKTWSWFHQLATALNDHITEKKKTKHLFV